MDRETVGALDAPKAPHGPNQIVTPLLRRALDRLATSLERRPGLFLAPFIVMYAIVTLAHAQRRFWYDEFFTYYICRLPHLSDIFHAVMDGLDFNPPLLYLTTRLSWNAFGVSPMTTRIPQMTGFLVFCLCIFVFTRRRAGTLFGFAAMSFPLLTAAYGYSSEARAYGIVMAFCGLTAVFWQSAVSAAVPEKRRYGALAGLALSAAGLILTHCYSVLIFMAFAAAELVRLSRRRRADWPLWFCLFAPLSIGFAYLPMLHNVTAYAVNSIYFHSGLGLAPRFYSFLFNDQSRAFEKSLMPETIWPLLIALIAICLSRRDSQGSDSHKDAAIHDIGRLPRHELTFLLALCLMPVYGNVLAGFTRAPFLDRYALSAVFGISALLGILASRVTGGNRRLGVSLAAGFSFWFTTGFVLWFASLSAQPKPYDFPLAKLSALPGSLHIVMSDPLMFLEANYYEPPSVTARLRFLTDHESALQYTGTDMFDRGYYTMRRWFPIKGEIAEYRDFLVRERRFYVYGPFDDPESWLLRKLTQENADLNVKGQFRYPGSHGESTILLQVDLTPK